MVPSPWVFTARKRDVGAADFDRRPYVSLERQGKATPPGLATGPRPWIKKNGSSLFGAVAGLLPTSPIMPPCSGTIKAKPLTGRFAALTAPCARTAAQLRGSGRKDGLSGHEQKDCC